jgi:hypothetical protein
MPNPKTKKTEPAKADKDTKHRRELSAAEKAVIETLEAEREAAVMLPRSKMTPHEESGKVTISHDTYDDYCLASAMACRAFGTIDHGYADNMVNEVVNASAPASLLKTIGNRVANNAILSAMSLDAQSPAEGMLIAQMVAVHNSAMSALNRSHAAQTVPVAGSYMNQANKLLRTFAAQMETLKRFRQKASQTVRVDHVHVNEGGQAIVGNVNQGGGGAQQKSEVQPHEANQPANGQGPEVRGTQSTGEALPSPGDAGEKEMPVAWREVARRAVG